MHRSLLIMNETKLSPVFSERNAGGHITDLVADPIEISINNQQLYAFCKEHTVGDILRYAISRSDIGEVACLLNLEFRLHNIKKGHQTNREVDGLMKRLHDNAADAIEKASYAAWVTRDDPTSIAVATLRAVAALLMNKINDGDLTVEELIGSAERSHQAGWLHRIAAELEGQS